MSGEGTDDEQPGAPASLKRGLGRVASHPGATAAAMIAGAMGALAVAAGERGALEVLRASGVSRALPAVALWTIGGGVAALAYGTSLGALLGGPRLRGALRRGTAAISLIAIERLLQFSLLLAAALPLGRWAALHPGADTVARAAALTAAIAPTLPLWALSVPAFAVAIARAAAGEPSWRALVVGLDLALRRLGLLVRTGLLALAATAPLWLAPLLLGRRIAAVQHPGLALAATGLAGALGMLSALVGYATLLDLSVRVLGAVASERRERDR